MVWKMAFLIMNNAPDDDEEEDEDDLKARIEEYKRRYTRVEREMIGLYIINTVFMAIMMVPLWYTGTAV